MKNTLVQLLLGIPLFYMACFFVLFFFFCTCKSKIITPVYCYILVSCSLDYNMSVLWDGVTSTNKCDEPILLNLKVL